MSITVNEQNVLSEKKVPQLSSTELLNARQWAYLKERYRMTKRELQIAKLICRGMSNEEVAQSLGIRHGTIKTHIRNLYRKLWVHNKISMLLKFIEDAGVLYDNSNSPMEMIMESKQEVSVDVNDIT